MGSTTTLTEGGLQSTHHVTPDAALSNTTTTVSSGPYYSNYVQNSSSNSISTPDPTATTYSELSQLTTALTALLADRETNSSAKQNTERKPRPPNK